ncbi:probable ATP-citrate synthase [Acanthaster planci]|uniref:ATP citrate synthase n=1 Tax=Acanthaster planci TaxID=133434 RepID=A0A8B7YDW6_ACAPL|nr:probable ATP-citrate synthase [Acanthaster planci]
MQHTKSSAAVGSERVVSEVSAKHLLRSRVQKRPDDAECVMVDCRTKWDELLQQNPWLKTQALRLCVGLEDVPQEQIIQDTLLKNVPNTKAQKLCSFIQSFIKCFRELHFTYLEINPLVVTDSEVYILDVAAKVDSKAAPLCKESWEQLQYAPSLCRDLLPEELHISQLAAGTPCSMNLTVLNMTGRIWSLVSGGGTSLVISEGVVRALQEGKEKLQANNISLFIRRSTLATVPNGHMPTALTDLGVPVHAFSVATPMTHLIQRALGLRDIHAGTDDANKMCPPVWRPTDSNKVVAKYDSDELFNGETRVGTSTPVTRWVSGEDKEERFLWAEGQVTIPVYSSMETALYNHPDASVVVNGAPGRIRCVLMIAGHIPDQQTRTLVQMAHNNGVMIVGPCTPLHLMQVNFIKPGSFRCNKFGNIGGPMEDLVSLRLHRPGSVGLVTRSGGLSIELLVSIARNTDGLYQGISLGGGKYTGTSFMDHLMSLEANPDVKILLLLGEFGGCEEHDVCEALRSGQLSN